MYLQFYTVWLWSQHTRARGRGVNQLSINFYEDGKEQGKKLAATMTTESVERLITSFQEEYDRSVKYCNEKPGDEQLQNNRAFFRGLMDGIRSVVFICVSCHKNTKDNYVHGSYHYCSYCYLSQFD